MATLKATGGSVLGMVTDVAEAVRSGVSGSSVWLSSWANQVQDRAQTDSELRSMVEQGKRALTKEVAAKDLSVVVKDIATSRSKDPEAYDQALKILNSITE